MSNLQKFAWATAALLVFAGATALLSYRSDSGDASAPTSVVQTSQTDITIRNLQTRLQTLPEDTASLDQLGFAYLQKARETADPSLYTSAEGVFGESLSLEPGGQQALIGLSSVQLARHDFAGAHDLAEQALTSGSATPTVYGALGDALMELGRYDEAVAAYQQMVDLRPDLDSYVRVSYAREIHGETDGAIEAMQLAVTASGTKGENAAWVRMQLGNLYFNQGDLDQAAQQYADSLAAFPGYVHALAAQGRVAAARGDYGDAAAFYEQAVARIPVVQYVVALGDAYEADGKPEDAQRQYELVNAITELNKANGVNTDLEIALYNADHDRNLDAAVSQAQAAYESAPSIPSADALAWALFKSGDSAGAREYIDEALRLGTRDASIHYHAGMIYNALGDEAAARDHLQTALDINPHFSLIGAPIAQQTLEDLGR